MTATHKPLVLMTHRLPDEWISPFTGEFNYSSGPSDAVMLDPRLLDQLHQAEGLLSLLTIPVTEELLAKAPNLRVVSNMAVGVDNIDIDACTKRGIPVGNTPGVLTESTADLTMALILSIARNIPGASRDALEGKWKTWLPAGWLGMELHGATLGIIGMGKIGQAVARRAHGFGMQILFTDPNQVSTPLNHKVNLEQLLQQSDIVSLHAPLTVQTRGMINQTTLTLMKRSAILINAARGPLVDTSALLHALVENKIAAAALDVTDPEPLPPSHPLYNLTNCLIVPHIGSATHTTRREMAELACRNLIAGLRGERLPHCVNPEVYSQ